MSSHNPDPKGLAETLGDLAVQMQSLKQLTPILKAIVEAAVPIVPGTRWAGVSILNRQRVDPAVSTDDLVARLDQFQTDLREGPAHDALRDGHTILIEDLENVDWPNFAPKALELGVRSMLAFRLFVERQTLGVLTLYGSEPHAFGDDSIAVGEVLAQHAAVALAGSTAEEQLQSAVASRDVIGQAKGILMHRDRLTGLQAFAALTKASQDTNLKLVDVARWLVKEHESTLRAD